MAVVLGCEEFVFLRCAVVFFAALVRGGHDGKRLDKRVAGDDDAASVDARLADGTLQARGAFHELVDNRVVGLESGI